MYTARRLPHSQDIPERVLLCDRRDDDLHIQLAVIRLSNMTWVSWSCFSIHHMQVKRVHEEEIPRALNGREVQITFILFSHLCGLPRPVYWCALQTWRINGLFWATCPWIDPLPKWRTFLLILHLFSFIASVYHKCCLLAPTRIQFPPTNHSTPLHSTLRPRPSGWQRQALLSQQQLIWQQIGLPSAYTAYQPTT